MEEMERNEVVRGKWWRTGKVHSYTGGGPTKKSAKSRWTIKKKKFAHGGKKTEDPGSLGAWHEIDNQRWKD